MTREAPFLMNVREYYPPKWPPRYSTPREDRDEWRASREAPSRRSDPPRRRPDPEPDYRGWLTY